MRINHQRNFLKNLLVTLPLFALSACGSAMQHSKTDFASGSKASVHDRTRPTDIQGERTVVASAEQLSHPFTAPSSNTDLTLGGLQPISAEQMLDQVKLRHDASQNHWSQGELTLAKEELDLGFRMLMLVPSRLDSHLEAQRDDLQLKLARMVVTMNAAQTGLMGDQSEIPLVMNEYVEREIRSFQTGERKFFIESYRRSGYYMDYILKALEEQHMPKELAWLPLIESGFNVRALSSARALGMWQFIPTTGYRFGLNRDNWIDQRMDPERSTRAALSYLRLMHGLFGDWSTALAGYNCGENLVAGVIRRQKVDYLDSFWDLFPKLPYETARYVPRFMATLHILRDPIKYGFDDLGEPYAPRRHETVTLHKQVSLKDLARLLEIEPTELTVLNPELRHGITPPTGYMLRVPETMGQTLLSKMTEVPETVLTAEARSYVSPSKVSASQSAYRVKQGDTLSSIARRFRVPLASLMQHNTLSSKNRLSVGQLLKIPRRGV